jgi:hypothetical protein
MLAAVSGFALTAACGEQQDIPASQLVRVVEANRESLKICYDAALERSPYKHEIKIQAAIHVEPSGKVAKVELDQEGLPGLGKCLREAIVRWSFPKAKDPTHTALPIILQPEVKKAQGPALGSGAPPGSAAPP